ncbi:hypothetical protein GGTG_00765 [Gaeumannomyces tritici R3-111a-1]|uniref:Uncharacterized protein n=1 Tax=Gaeumannomyces tritici (strain R3-111a-1) TaxID=644352 RepID=J3NHM8_GAET3|nr:hypothetical protein GGTG_00765 [Gaeumannomyces tritici R3-111a-1]EJT80771.1 hypothetical protein GGTG_00765 [Gaeumannomyces tritici R3-111a-1]
MERAGGERLCAAVCAHVVCDQFEGQRDKATQGGTIRVCSLSWVGTWEHRDQGLAGEWMDGPWMGRGASSDNDFHRPGLFRFVNFPNAQVANRRRPSQGLGARGGCAAKIQLNGERVSG